MLSGRRPFDGESPASHQHTSLIHVEHERIQIGPIGSCSCGSRSAECGSSRHIAATSARPDGRSVCRSGTPVRLTRPALWTTVLSEQGGPNLSCSFAPVECRRERRFHNVVQSVRIIQRLTSGIATVAIGVVFVVRIKPFQSIREHDPPIFLPCLISPSTAVRKWMPA